MPAPATRPEWRAAADALADRHPVTARMRERHGVPAPAPGAPAAERFEALARMIAFQQLHGRAAATIWARVRSSVGRPFTPQAVLATTHPDLRAAGLSAAKTAALVDLAAKCADGTVRLERIGRLDDAAVIEHLSVVRGIGPWTAQMFAMFQLRRLDVWPTGDFGVRAGYAKAFGLDAMPSEREIQPLGDAFAPYRSVLAWWCWRETDSTPE